MSGIYDLARYRLLTAALDWRSQNLFVSAWDGTPDFNPADTTLAAIVARGHTELGVSLPITGLAAASDGSAQSDPAVIPIAVGANVSWFTVAIEKTPHSSSELVIFVDDTEAPLPFVANGLDVVLQPDWVENQAWFRP